MERIPSFVETIVMMAVAPKSEFLSMAVAM
jgi:hypothetical protein